MKYSFEWSAQKDIKVTPGNYFESIVLAGDTLYPATSGRDEFQLAGLIMPGKRLSGCGRSKFYRKEDFPAGTGTIEAVPSTWVALTGRPSKLSFKIATDIILDPGLLASYLSLDITTEDETAIHIPLNRPDIQITWQSRGSFVVQLNKI